MKTLKKLFVWLCLLAIALVALAYVLPAEYRVERSLVINAKPKAIHRLINRPSDWPKWTVWTKDTYPAMQIQFSGPEEGVGAVYTWTDPKAGNGRLEITRTDVDQGVWYTLDFDQGKFVSQGGLVFEEVGEATRVTWFNGGQLGLNPVNRYFGIFMDRMMGPDFQRGLENLKRIVEAR